MVHCNECGTKVTQEQSFCDECGAQLNETTDSTEPFVDQYGAKPLPFAEGRSEFIHLYGKLIGSIPIFGRVMKFFLGISFWCYGIWLKILQIITLGADVTDRFTADFKYIKDSFKSGYSGDEPPSHPNKH